MKIGFTYTPNFFTSELLRALQSRLAGHQVLPWVKGDPAPASDLEAVLVMGQFERNAMKSQGKLALIQTTSAGYEGVDLDAATELGIWVSFSPSDVTGNAVSVAEFAVLLMIGASRHLNQALRSMKDPAVEVPRLNPVLSGKTVCIVGLGGIGQLLADRLRPFGMRLVAVDNHEDRAPDDIKIFPSDQLKSAVAEADYIVLCVPAKPENESLIDEDTLAAMKHGATLINIGRGMLIDENAFYAAVKSGQIAAGGLDVLRDETQGKSPLLEFPQLLITPHIAGTTDMMLHGTVDYVSKAIAQFEEGKKFESILNSPEAPRRTLK